MSTKLSALLVGRKSFPSALLIFKKYIPKYILFGLDGFWPRYLLSDACLYKISKQRAWAKWARLEFRMELHAYEEFMVLKLDYFY